MQPIITYTPQTVKKYRQLDERLQVMLIYGIEAVVKAEKKDITDALFDVNPECLYDSPSYEATEVRVKNIQTFATLIKEIIKIQKHNNTLLNIL